MLYSVALLLVITPIFVSSKSALRIGGGREVPNGFVPYQVSLRDTSTLEHFCSGSIVTPRAILTTAHCVERMNPEQMKAVVGTNQLNAGGQSYRIRQIVYHGKYVDGPNDIAIIFTDKEIQFTDKVQAVELNDEPVRAGEELRVTGWGQTSYFGALSNDLLELEVTAVSYKDCRTALKGLIPVFKTDICAVAGPGKGACNGDSGGPLVDVYEGKLVGIVSGGFKCITGKPDIYTSVHSFMPWIEEVLHRYGDDDESSSYDHDYNDEDDDDYYYI